MGTFHPHGDTAIYDVRSVPGWRRPFSMRHTLVDGHGNFGGMGPDDGARGRGDAVHRVPARRARSELLEGIDEETVEFSPNYDNTDQQPDVLPARYPNLLVNGSQGIAVGMATKIPPHNLAEVIDAALHLLAHPEATSDDLMAFVKGPDFPTGGQILGRQGILDAYRTGRGSIRMRAVAEIEEGRADTTIVVTEFPYEVSPGAVAVQDPRPRRPGRARRDHPRVEDHSAARKNRLVIKLKRDANANVVLNKLYKGTPLQTTFAVNTLALVDGVPRTSTPWRDCSRTTSRTRWTSSRGACAVPASQRRGTGPHRRGAAARDRPARRGHRDDPGLRGPSVGQSRAHRSAVRVLRG